MRGLAVPSVRMMSGFRATTPSMLITADDARTSAKMFRSPARAINSVRKLPLPTVIGGWSHTSRNALRAFRAGASASASSRSNVRATESAARS